MIPEELRSIHLLIQEARNKKQDRHGQMSFDYGYYHLEDTHIEPLFSKSHKVLDIANNLSKLSNMRTLKIHFRKFAMTKFIEYNLITNKEYDSVQLKYTHIKREVSFYNGLKRTIYINEKTFQRALGKKENCIELLYVFMHEMAHALADKWFFNHYDHNSYFHYCNMELFKNFTGINAHKVYRSKDIKSGLTFDDYCEQKGRYYRILNKNIKKQSFKSFRQAIYMLNSRYGIKLEFSIVKKPIRFSKKYKKIPEFISENKNTETIKYKVQNGGNLDFEYIIRIIRTEDGIDTIIYKDYKIRKEYDKKYIKFLKKIKEERKND